MSPFLSTLSLVVVASLKIPLRVFSYNPGGGSIEVYFRKRGTTERYIHNNPPPPFATFHSPPPRWLAKVATLVCVKEARIAATRVELASQAWFVLEGFAFRAVLF